MSQEAQSRNFIHIRDAENSADVVINQVHFNGTTLHHWNYTLYSNGTISNGSSCWLIFDQYKPAMLSNGTFVNSTSCYAPVHGMGPRGAIGLTFGAWFAVGIVFTLINLRKHGRNFLPHEKRWAAVGRRWQWYWMLFVATCGIVSTLAGIDVDRDYLPSTAIILQSFFYYLLLPGLLACIWESVRHWGSWHERQLCDVDEPSIPHRDLRSRKEFYMPLLFYLLAWLVFFMTIPRSWTVVQEQRSPSQMHDIARPSATDARFKVGAVLAFLAWCLICYDLKHNLHYYKPRSHNGPGGFLFASLNRVPLKFILTIFLSAIRIGYALVAAWDWSVSPLKLDVPVGWLYGLGYAPALLIIIIYCIYGYIDSNEDRALIAQRAERGQRVDAELGVGTASRKPSWWWSKIQGGHHWAGNDDAFMGQRLERLTTEIGGGGKLGSTSRNATMVGVELGDMTPPVSREDNSNPFSDENIIDREPQHSESPSTSSSRGQKRDGDVAAVSDTSSSDTARSRQQVQPQVVRSMLDL